MAAALGIGRFLALVLLLFASSGEVIRIHAQPSNDLCANATDIATFPFIESGTLLAATNDDDDFFYTLYTLSTCYAGGFDEWEEFQWRTYSDVWYKIHDVPEGAEIQVVITGTGRLVVDGWVFMSTTTACPDEFTCATPIDLLKMSSLSPTITSINDTAPMYSWKKSLKWPTTCSIYYLAVRCATAVKGSSSNDDDVPPEFELLVNYSFPPTPDNVDMNSSSYLQPINDLCTSATEVTTFPYFEHGTLGDVVATNCGGSSRIETGVWYKISNVPDGARIDVSISGFGSAQVWGTVWGGFMPSSTGSCPSSNAYDEDSAAEFLCQECNISSTMASMVEIDGSESWELTINWNATKDANYLELYTDRDYAKVEVVPYFDLSIDITVFSPAKTSDESVVVSDGPPPPPINDDCDFATDIYAFPFTDSGSLANATQDSYGTCAGGVAGWKGTDVWYQISNVPDGKVVEVDIMGKDATVVQIKPLISNDLGNCPDRWQCAEPAAIYGSPSIDDVTGAWNYSVVWPTITGTIYYLALYTEVENVGPKFDITVKLLDPYIPTTNSLSTTTTTTTTTNGSNVKDVCFAAWVLMGVLSGASLV